MLNPNKHRTKCTERQYPSFFLIKVNDTWTVVRGKYIGRTMIAYLDEEGKRRISIWPHWRGISYLSLSGLSEPQCSSTTSFSCALDAAAHENVRDLNQKFSLSKKSIKDNDEYYIEFDNIFEFDHP